MAIGLDGRAPTVAPRPEVWHEASDSADDVGLATPNVVDRHVLGQLDVTLATLSTRFPAYLKPSFQVGYLTSWLVQEHRDIAEDFIRFVEERPLQRPRSAG